MNKEKVQTKQISKKIIASIIGSRPDSNLNDKLYAINWFNVKRKWLYDFYNKLAYTQVKNVGGQPLIKVRLVKKIIGDDELGRQLLLIVKYPNALAILNLLSNKLFQLFSGLRVLSVGDFVFGFTTRLDGGAKPNERLSKYEGELKYLVHVFEGGQTKLDAMKIKDTASRFDIFTHFIGEKSAILGFEKKADRLRTFPFLLDGLLVLGAFEESQFEELLFSSAYSEFMNSHKIKFIGLYKREV